KLPWPTDSPWSRGRRSRGTQGSWSWGSTAPQRRSETGLRSVDLDPVLLSRIQFGFLISFHIIFPAFTIGLAAWLATIEGARLATGNALYRRVLALLPKAFAPPCGMGAVPGGVVAFRFRANWSGAAQRAGSIQGPLL